MRLKWKLFLASFVLILMVKCEAKTLRKRRYAPEFKEAGNLSFRGCGRASPDAKTIDEQFPWIVRVLAEALPKPKTCLGVIISSNTIVTSAFCIDSDITGNQRTQKVLLVKHLTSTDGHQSSQNILHEEFDILKLDNNIAVLKFDHDLLAFGARPICLWNQELRNNDIAVSLNNGIGTIIGVARGSDNFNLAKGDVKTENPEDCKKLIFPRYSHYLDNGRLCARFADSNPSECVGGFGAPLQFQIGDKWFLRGLLDSAFKAKDSSLPCYKHHVLSFTDTARHVKFITHNAEIGLKNAPNPFEVAFTGRYSFPGCGRRFSSTGNQLVFGGKAVDIKEVPWQVALYNFKDEQYSFKCGGSLISTRFVLTAAHCVYGFKGTIPIPTAELIIFLGKTHSNSEFTNDGGVNSKAVERIIPFDEYSPNSASNKHDIALIQLRSPVQLSHSISTVCLWAGSAEETFIAGKTGMMSGWGLINYAGDHGKTLQKLEMPILSKEKCSSINIPHAANYFSERLKWQTLCAGYEKKKTGACNGDSGGPLVVKRGERFFLRGLVSESVSHPQDAQMCNTDYPGIFTDVALYRAWIKQKTGNELLNYDTTSTQDF